MANSVQVMGILNVTPDSFSDGGRFQGIDKALVQAETIIEEGATYIDIGGESTRPGALEVPIAEEIQRVIPILTALKQHFPTIKLSVDTCKPEVMQAALDVGVDMINDILALQASKALEVCAQSNVQVCLMHMQGVPRTMQQNPYYNQVIEDVVEFLRQRLQVCAQAGIASERIWIDPGFGFGKNLEHNVSLLKHLDQLMILNQPLLVGLSRKSMIGALLGQRPVEDRVFGSVSAAVIAALKGAQIIRVHDVKATVDALKIVQAIQI